MFNKLILILLIFLVPLPGLSAGEWKRLEFKDRELKHFHILGFSLSTYGPGDAIYASGKKASGALASLEYGFFLTDTMTAGLSSGSFSDSEGNQSIQVRSLLFEATFLDTPVKFSAKNWKFYSGFGLGNLRASWNPLPGLGKSSGSCLGVSVKAGFIYSICHYCILNAGLKYTGGSINEFGPETLPDRSFSLSDTSLVLGFHFLIQ